MYRFVVAALTLFNIKMHEQVVRIRGSANSEPAYKSGPDPCRNTGLLIIHHFRSGKTQAAVEIVQVRVEQR